MFLAGKNKFMKTNDFSDARVLVTGGAGFIGSSLVWALNRFPAFKQQPIAPPEVALATLLELVPLLAYRRWVNKELDVPWYYALTHPLAGAIFEGIIAQSAWRVLTRKGVDWSGRQYYSQKNTHRQM